MSKSNSESESRNSLWEFLENREVYPHKPERVKHIQTHISHVFIAPPFVYKIKKSIDFGFLDYSTLEKRKHYCEREVALNRRLCSDIYLGVIPISKKENTFTFNSDNPDEVVEYAVKMKMLDEEYFLYSYIENGSLTNQHLDRVADKLAKFYLQQEPKDDVLQYGEIEQIRFNTDENFEQTESYIGKTIENEEYQAIKYFTDQYFEKNQSLFNRRVTQKRIVDGHGDLHLEHIHIRPESICIYDCIEFNERFRCGDLAADLAYLAMDLDFQECRNESRYFVEQMAQKLDDPDLSKMIDFYKCYRGYVKGKVKSLQSGGEENSPKKKKQLQKIANDYFHLSLRYALLGSHPVLLIFMGRIGTGKSTLAEHLANILKIDYFSSDRIRKTLAGLPLYKRPDSSAREKLYSAEMSQKTYRQLFKKINTHLGSGKSAILDATFSLRSQRKEFENHLESIQANYLFIEAQASDETILDRLKTRETEKDTVSDARLEDFEMLTGKYESPKELSESHLISVSTKNRLPETLENLYKKLVDHHLRR
ncbi:AAA family ATPase [Rhodohalobacter barkolensis]|uniref:Phosphotransferase n=1 Tax=Rhodohalobacter barkolensis TaxID=2053187 RepID=A0A2N0VE22_9BACT|nr:AAA family ATPase [Rhodohalobacter barkolensis]PKD42410.1 phosphotransferase [Rhodohalobacter barkolensis]